MFAYRQRGLVTLHSVIVSGLATGLLPLYELFVPYVPRLQLEQEVGLLPYIVAIFLALVASSSLIRREGGNLHLLGVSGAVALAFRQTLYIAAAIFTVVFSLKDQVISRLFLGSYLLLVFCFLVYLHRTLPSAIAKMLFPDRNKLPCLFIGRSESLDDLDSWITSRGHIGICPIGFLSNDQPTRAEKVLAPYLGKIDQIESVLKNLNIAQVIMLDWNQPTEEIERIVEICEQEGVRFLIYNNYVARFAREMTAVEEGGRHFLVMQTEPLEDPLNRAAKRMLDLLVALPVCLFVIPPLCLLVWAFQRIQAPGPLFFNRPRGGQNRQPFNMYKFRSMYAANSDINKQATKGDSRIYPFGNLMRKTSLDEFPQFLNVLRGNMSIVGPRPHLPQHDDEFSKITRTYHGRSLVKPGITGLAQIRGYRGEITEPHKLHRRVYWDLYYVSRWSLWLDMRIILTTAWQVAFPPDTAY
jgi:exopolysaccharide biosynthesis polyprenyl glycosylphosphotransferase